MNKKEFTSWRSSANRKFCSSKCSVKMVAERGNKTRHRLGLYAASKNYSRSSSGWVELGGQRFYARSSWEENYGRYLEWLRLRKEIKAWEHEPETFWFHKIKRGVRSYLPDFKVYMNNGAVEFHEVKGWMDSKSKTKIKRMKKYYPEVSLDVIDSKRYAALSKSLGKVIPNWRKRVR